jgi:5-methylcytosine-specific restriction endonuclease McrA
VCGSVIELHCFNMKRRYCDTCLVSQRRRDKDKRRALKRDAYVADVSPTKIYRRDGYRCKLCSKRLNMRVVVPHPMAPTIDHIIPLAQGGTHEPANAQAAHFLCNSIKGDRGGNEQLLLIG